MIEDYARFVIEHHTTTGRTKALRHQLTETLKPLLPDMIAARDIEADIGREIEMPSEYERLHDRDIALAACSRLSESLRSIEEQLKLVKPLLARELERLRYRSYTIAQGLHAKHPFSRETRIGVRVLITEALCTYHAWDRVAEEALACGALTLQLREKQLEANELCRRTERLLSIASRYKDAKVIVNDRLDVAMAAGAHGVHLGQTDIPAHHARRIAGHRFVIGVSTSNLDEAKAARQDDADYCGVGPMFPTTTKDKPEIAGPAYLRRYLEERLILPGAVAIGGITPENVGELVEAGAYSIAVSSCVCGAEDPRQVCEKLVDAIKPGSI